MKTNELILGWHQDKSGNSLVSVAQNVNFKENSRLI